MTRTTTTMITLATLVGCGPPAGFETSSCKDFRDSTCIQITSEEGADRLLEVVNGLVDDTVVLLGSGTFQLDNAVSIRNASGVSLIGQGMDATVLDFAGVSVQANGVDVVGDDFLIQDLTIQDSVKDGLRIEDSSDVTIRRVRATWSAGPAPENGGYGLYPVKVRRVLLEDSEAFHASDAGIYVGQCIEAIVRNNVARANVAGLEIENTQFADVYGNLVEDNTGGLVVFDLPGNPIVGRDVYIHDNIVRNNNRANFAPGGVVGQIPSGTGTFAMASRRVEIVGNTYANNNTVDIAVISGLAIQSDAMRWAIQPDQVIGDIGGLQLDAGPDGQVINFRSSEIYVHGNSHSGSGTRPDNSSVSARPLGFLIAVTYGGTPVDTVVYDTISESAFDKDDAAGNSNDNHVCVGADPGVTFASLNLPGLAQATVPNKNMTYRPAPPFVPFDCDGFRGGPIVVPTFAD
jgi:parallel beta-helix repeat protein